MCKSLYVSFASSFIYQCIDIIRVVIRMQCYLLARVKQIEAQLTFTRL